MPTGAQLLISASDAVQGSTTEKTFCSRMRRAINCVNWDPKSRMTMDWLSGDWVSLDWDSTDEFLKSDRRCKALRCGEAGRKPRSLHQAPRAISPGPDSEYRSKSAHRGPYGPSEERVAAE